MHGTPLVLIAPGRPRRAVVASTFAGLGALTAAVLVRNPMRNTVFPTCPFHLVTSGWCPGCGATRASYLLLHGDVVGALRMNALWVVLAPFVVYGLVAWGLHAFGRPVLPQLRVQGRLAIGLLAAIGLFFLARNLPGLREVLSPPGA